MNVLQRGCRYKYSSKPCSMRSLSARSNSHFSHVFPISDTKMPSHLAVALVGALISVAFSLPQISLPPLVPAIPGVTEPLASNAPPLPILQLPTPPLDSPPFTPSNIKPKKIGHFWTGAGDNEHAGESSLQFVLVPKLTEQQTSWRPTVLTMTLSAPCSGLQTYRQAATALIIPGLRKTERPSSVVVFFHY